MAVVLFPTPPFWFTMATTGITGGILARCRRVFLLTPHLVAFWQAPPRYGGISPASPSPFESARDVVPSPPPPASEAPLCAPRPSLRASPQPSRPPRAPRPAAALSWRRPTPPPSTKARSTRLTPTAVQRPSPSRRHTPLGAPTSWKRPPPSHSLPPYPSATARLPPGARSGLSSPSTRSRSLPCVAHRSLWVGPANPHPTPHRPGVPLRPVAGRESN